jgi:hypothetical protein
LGKSHELLIVLNPDPATTNWLTWRNREYATIAFRVRGTGMVGSYDPSSLGDRVGIRDLDHDTNRLLRLELPLPICEVAPCGDGRRLCIAHGSRSETFLSIVDLRTGKKIRTVTGGGWTVSADGRRLAYHDLDDQFICIDIDDGRLLYREVLHQGTGFLSPEGKYVAISKYPFPGGYVFDVAEKRRVSTFTKNPQVFSPDGQRLSDSDGNVWDLASNRIISRGMDVYADRGRKVASVYHHAIDGTRVKFLDLDTNEELTSERVPETYTAQSRSPPALATVDTDGHYVRTAGPREDSRILMNLNAVLEWLGYKPDSRLSESWALLDARSGAFLHQGTGELIAVSADGRYVISGDEDGRHAKIYELPLRRSWLFTAVAGGMWTALLLTMRRWWPGRVSSEAYEVEGAHVRLSKASAAGSP